MPHHRTTFRDGRLGDANAARSARARALIRLACVGAIVVFVAGCAIETTKHGALVTRADLQQVQPGMSKDQVRTVLGSPNTSSAIGNGADYYISTTKVNRALVGQEVVDRTVVAVYFDQFGTVDRVASYGLRDGRVIDLATDKTLSAKGEEGILQAFFRGIGTSKAAPGGVSGPGGT